MIFQIINLVMDGWVINSEIALRWLSLDCMMTSQHYFRYWLGAWRHQAITWANVSSHLWCHMLSQGHNELKKTRKLAQVQKNSDKVMITWPEVSTPKLTKAVCHRDNPLLYPCTEYLPKITCSRRAFHRKIETSDCFDALCLKIVFEESLY